MKIFRIFFDSTALKYAMTGVANTAAGYSLFLLCYYVFAINIFLANAVVYAVGLTCAFVLNHYYVFKCKGRDSSKLLRFILVFLVAFIINQAVLWIVNSSFGLVATVAQIGAMISYSVSFYLLNRFYVFH